MGPVDYNSISSIRQFLESKGLAVSKRFGQNFLISPGVRRKICSFLDVPRNAEVWEIGPGIGAMTEFCLAEAASVKVFELDYGFVRVLQELYGGNPACSIVPGDFMETGIPLLEAGIVPDRMLGNLPYSSGSAMMYKIVETGRLPELSVITLQREVARRLAAGPGSKEYSLFSIVCQFAYEVEDLGDVAPGAFYPVPEVVSTVLRLKPHHRFDSHKNRGLFFTAAKALFQARRKTIKNNLFSSTLVHGFSRETLLAACAAAGINPGDRGEQLSVDEIAAFSEALEAARQ